MLYPTNSRSESAGRRGSFRDGVAEHGLPGARLTAIVFAVRAGAVDHEARRPFAAVQQRLAGVGVRERFGQRFRERAGFGPHSQDRRAGNRHFFPRAPLRFLGFDRRKHGQDEGRQDVEDAGVFDRTVDWAVTQGIETATFHILTPYPGTGLHTRIAAEGRIRTEDWDLYDTRHAVFEPAKMTRAQLEDGYWRAYRDFYRWGAILRGASAHDTAAGRLRHLAYSAGWKKFEPLWDAIIRAKRASAMLPGLEAILHGFGLRMPRPAAETTRRGEKARKELPVLTE